MARKALCHRRKLRSGGQVDLRHIAVAGGTRDLLIQVLLVVELQVRIGNDDASDERLEVLPCRWGLGTGFFGHPNVTGGAGRRGRGGLFVGIGAVDRMTDRAVFLGRQQSIA
jgi:hypothetical protein